jgi:hypothetical protein
MGASETWCEKCRTLRESLNQDPTPERGHLRQESSEVETSPWRGTGTKATTYRRYRCEDPLCKTLWFRIETEDGDFIEWAPVLGRLDE